MTIERAEITGLILADGRGGPISGVDKGLLSHLGAPLALRTLLRLAPQVGQLMINANRNLAAYESMGVPVWPDGSSDQAGPLAGWLTGLERCTTRYMVTVPCDAPGFPLDLVARLGNALAGANAEIAMAATRDADAIRLEPEFCLVDSMLLESLLQFLQAGQREITRWTGRHRCVQVAFDDAGAFDDAAASGTLQGQQVRSSSVG